MVNSSSNVPMHYDNFCYYCKKIDVNKDYLEFYAEQHLFLPFCWKNLPKNSTLILEFVLNIWHFCWQVCDKDTMTVSPHAILSKQTNFWWKSKSNFEAQYFLLATEFSVSIDIKSDHDKPNYNPYLHRFFCSKDESFHNTEYYSE